MRDIIINKTEKRRVTISVLSRLKYKFGKFLNLHNFILRKKELVISLIKMIILIFNLVQVQENLEKQKKQF